MLKIVFPENLIFCIFGLPDQQLPAQVHSSNRNHPKLQEAYQKRILPRKPINHLFVHPVLYNKDCEGGQDEVGSRYGLPVGPYGV